MLKKLVSQFLVLVLLLVSIPTSSADFTPPSYWQQLLGTNNLTTNPLTLDVSIGGISTGNINMGGHYIYNNLATYGYAGNYTIGALGGTNNEAITYNFETANTVGVSSATGVTKMVLDSIGMTLGANLDMNNQEIVGSNKVTFGYGKAVTAGDYSIGRDADATNHLHLNVPTGATYELSVNDTKTLEIGYSALKQYGAAGGFFSVFENFEGSSPVAKLRSSFVWDQLFMILNSPIGKQLVFTTIDADKDYDHDATNYATTYWQGITDPDVSNNDFGAIYHNDAGLVLTTGVNTGTGTAPVTMDNYISFAPRGVEAMRVNGNGAITIGSDASITDFPLAKVISSTGNTGHTYTGSIGLVGEANATSGDIGTGVGGVARTHGAQLARGVSGVAKVEASADSAAAVGVYGRAEDAHSGGANIGLAGYATGGATNYALWMSAGNIHSTIAQIWELLDNNSSALSLDATGKTGILEIDTTNGSEGIKTSGLITQKGLKTDGYSATLADDALIALPSGTGLLTVWIGDWQEYARETMIKADGTVTTTSTSANVATTDLDTNLCIYDGGDHAIIKNRLGSSLTVKYEFKY